MTKSLEQVREELNAKIPREVVKERTQSGFSLNYLEGHYVIDRLNSIFGAENWTKGFELTKTFDGEVNGKAYVSYIAKVKLTVVFPGGINKTMEDVGFGDGRDSNPGKAHELAVKEAVTDGLKRCAKDLGMSMGLALYDKEQVNVEEEAPVRKASEGVGANNNRDAASAGNTKQAGNDASGKTASKEDYAALRTLIQSTARVLDSQKKLPLTQFKEQYLGKYKADKVKDLTDNQVAELYTTLKTTFTDLRLN